MLNKRGEFNRCKLTRMDVYVMWEQKCWDQAWAKRGDLERDVEADLNSRAKEKRMRVEEEGGGLCCIGRECTFKGPGEESIPTEPDGSKIRDYSDPDQTSIMN
jgi:hypothetical protein